MLIREDARVNPAPARCRTIRFEVAIATNLLVISHAVTVDLLQNLLNDRLAGGTSRRIIPRKRVETGIAMAWIARGFLLEPAAEVIHEPAFAARVPRRLDCLLVELIEPLRIGEAAAFFRVACRRKEKYFR